MQIINAPIGRNDCYIKNVNQADDRYTTPAITNQSTETTISRNIVMK